MVHATSIHESLSNKAASIESNIGFYLSHSNERQFEVHRWTLDVGLVLPREVRLLTAQFEASSPDDLHLKDESPHPSSCLLRSHSMLSDEVCSKESHKLQVGLYGVHDTAISNGIDIIGYAGFAE